MKHREKHLFLDLENTLVEPVTEGWANVSMLALAPIKRFIANFNPDHTHVFSFAVGDSMDVRQFELHMRERLQSTLGIQFTRVLTVNQDILPACCRQKNLSANCVDFSDLVDFWGKPGAFKLFTQDMFQDTQGATVALIDDVVEDEDFFVHRLNLQGLIREVQRLP